MKRWLKEWLFIYGFGRLAKEYSLLSDSVDRMQFLMREFGIRYHYVLDEMRLQEN
jgi:hypothetical protein